VSFQNEGTSTDLYLVRVWRQVSRDGTSSLRGKLQHVVSGATSYFEGMSDLPEVLERLMKEGEAALDPGVISTS